ncbi:hypothetical protein L1987_50923 [Smallanthus sonchifolius]|uniref:Uncharacterized protein n=1 Tax=Smallanthus sonchifolius TaxID=185202 RepID=A0ACB9EPI7_9ASTR|nr:hypothetical protein L1987_50923 [Smallanthus sonchifolius]
MPNTNYKLCIPFFVALLLVDSVTDVESISNDYDHDHNNKRIKWLSPWEVDYLPLQPRPSFYRDLRSCLKTLTRRCNYRLYTYVFTRQEIHRPCCKKLHEMEMGCLESLAWVLSRANWEYRSRNVDQRFKDVMHMCSGFD